MAVLNVAAQLGRSITPKPRQFFTTPVLYSTFVTAMLASKLVHLYNHLTSLPPLLTLLYMPTFLALDVITAILYFLLIHFRGRSWILTILMGIVKWSFCLTELETAASEISFYLETGGEMKWSAASSFASDPAGMKLLLSGAMQALLVAIVLVVIARFTAQPLYNKTECMVSAIWQTFTGRRLWFATTARVEEERSGPEMRESSRSLLSEEEALERSPSRESDRHESVAFLADHHKLRKFPSWCIRIIVLGPIVGTSILQFVRPTTFPYAHMSGTLPYTLREMWSPSGQEMCRAGFSGGDNLFPFPHLVSENLWESAKGKLVGWTPNLNGSLPEQKDGKHAPIPSWLPNEAPEFPGFERWYLGKNELTHESPQSKHPHYHQPHEESPFHRSQPHAPSGKLYGGVHYEPSKDPMRITNLDKEILRPITELLDENPLKIKHVVLLSLESTRKDIFPFKKDSHLYDIIMKSHGSDSNTSEVNDALSKLSANAEWITGEASGFETETQEAAVKSSSWRNLSKDKGGLNVVGAFTGSTASFKSFLGSTCGVSPLPVDFTVEAHGYIYQPCMPSILNLFNQNKTSKEGRNNAQVNDQSAKDDITSMPWRSIFAQSITDHYDFQDELEQRMGFTEVISRSTLLDPNSKYYPPKEPESNYFGYPEPEIMPYLKDVFREAEEKNERMFLTHFTSSTHHPWSVPEAGGEDIDYMGRTRFNKERSLNKFLNTVKYQDGWIGHLMDLLEKIGVAEETLVVMVGDHGMTFKEESPVHSTFENGHISNMRVPLVFHHPLLPRIQLNLNATSLSIIPTILDLLSVTSSLNSADTEVAQHLMNQYEGQSLIRPFQAAKNGRQQWNIAVLNAGGALLSVSSAALPHRLVLPVCKAGTYRFTSNLVDPYELDPIEDYSIQALAKRIEKDKRFGLAGANWALEAEKMGKWWVKEQRRKWGYHGAALQDDRSAGELEGAGTTRKKHWWET